MSKEFPRFMAVTTLDTHEVVKELLAAGFTGVQTVVSRGTVVALVKTLVH